MSVHDAPLRPRLGARLRHSAARAAEHAVALGLPPGWAGWRWVREEKVQEYLARGGPGHYMTIHPERRISNPLPGNIPDADLLSDNPDWFGFSMRDVPTRLSGETFQATLPDCTVVSFYDNQRNEFWPTVINRDHKALVLRELRFRRGHGEALRLRAKPVRLERATWIAERVYENHSHWLTAHLPKLCLLKQRGALDDLVLPARRNPVIDHSLRLLGIEPSRFRTHDPKRPLQVDALTILGTDRFRPELLRPVREVLAPPGGKPPWRHVFISRAGAQIRRLVNESELAAILAKAGFKSVLMERLSFAEQIRLMSETAVLLAPHGAGMTNMMFCPPGTHVVEIADTSYPNPNFYALACAMGLHYWLVEGRFSGGADLHRLDRDLCVDPEAVRRVLAQIGV